MKKKLIKKKNIEEEIILIPKKIMHELEEDCFKDCKSNYVPPDYENDFELKLDLNDIEININKIQKNTNLKKIEFRDIVTIEILEKLSILKQIEEINFSNLDTTLEVFKDILITLQKFQNLKKLKIQNYYNSKYLPNEIGNLSNLTHLCINLTKIEELAKSISNLSNLISLDVSMNELKSLANSIKNMKNLKEIDISYNEFIDVPAELLGFDNLRILNLKYKEN